MLYGAALAHKKQFDALVTDGGVSVVVRDHAPRASAASSLDKVLGARPAEDPVPGQYGTLHTVPCLVSMTTQNPNTHYQIVPPTIDALGRASAITIVLRCKLADVLLDPDKPQGQTIFDTCKDVFYDGEAYTVRGSDRTGLMPLAPYIFWVGLIKSGVSK